MAAAKTQGKTLCSALARRWFITLPDSPRSMVQPIHTMAISNVSTTSGYSSCEGSEDGSDIALLTNVLASTSIT
jgi:hypothetical protein